MPILKILKEKAKLVQGSVVFPESEDERILQAAYTLIEEKIAHPWLVGNREEVLNQASRLGLKLDTATIIEPDKYERIGEFEEYFYNKRKSKGLQASEAASLVRNPMYFGAHLVKFGIVNGMVAGACSTTADVHRAALLVVGVLSGLKTVSNCFIMNIPSRGGEKHIYLFSDCAVVPNPDPEQLADITMSTVHTRNSLIGDEPRVALLSFSTKGSAEHELVQKVRSAKAILDERKADFIYDGELQLDAAIVESVASRKAPGSPVDGKANILIFPDLQAGNIGYKLVQRFGGADAIGPVIQGLAAPVCDLSRGCSAMDVVNTSILVILISK
ncbi:MAG: phosphate acetyltransferase [Candidatus Cloacimonetes bacterium]|nr:phosphate acetyltransferase [Candidatus Cloacimonadota bacterium]